MTEPVIRAPLNELDEWVVRRQAEGPHVLLGSLMSAAVRIARALGLSKERLSARRSHDVGRERKGDGATTRQLISMEGYQVANELVEEPAHRYPAQNPETGTNTVAPLRPPLRIHRRASPQTQSWCNGPFVVSAS